ncbi:EamA family transporter [Streptomyces sclerotialus]|uniref:EamA family transporter n=1 Tax=Streptomyces sclerotialus TaxID=1957 RepID=UPI0004C8C73C
MGALLALASAVCYGIADFTGGLLSRRTHFVTVALVGQAGGLLLSAVAAALVPATSPHPADLAWGALSGVGTGLGMLFLYRGLARGAMSVVVPVSAVGGVALPVLVGVAVLNDRPSAVSWLGTAVALPALWLVGRARPGDGPVAPAASAAGLAAGCGIALQYLALAQAGDGSGLWPVVAGRAAAVVTIAPLAAAAPARLRTTVRRAAGAAATGMTASAALVFYLLALREQLVSIAVVLSSLYPAIPVLLGVTVLRERLTRAQLTGVTAAGAAVALLALG